MNKSILGYSIALLLLTAASCRTKQSQSDNTQTTEQPATVSAPTFNADSAYLYIEKQLAFGPRVPNTPAHVHTADYLAAKFKQFGCDVTVQSFIATTWDGRKINARNIIGSINPLAGKRIFISSHWDSRPIADSDSIVANRTKPVPAANDGASGVAVMLELARSIQQTKSKPYIGIDFICFDVEDLGDGEKATKDFEKGSGEIDYLGYGLGSRYWSKTPHKPGYSAYYGILLDMVGAKGATFPKEGLSMKFAPTVVNNVWQTASRLGFSQYFIDTPGGEITDDHVAPNYIAKIPTIDIIQLNTISGGFFPAHHTLADDMRYIDRGTLKAVGQTLLQVLYNEQ
ncbi:M28 family peptidase [Spirosoma flavum]|uniref:M28 family peptidase n=1 Tax=Spirosoma flavum TaxID=2048557 RepID=A0ABW6AA01_9BACT